MAEEVTLAQVLSEIRALAASVETELAELRTDVAKATQHFGDVDALQIDMQRVLAHLASIDEKFEKIDEFIYGDPPLQSRLEALEQKQAKDHAADAAGVVEAGTAGDEEHGDVIERHVRSAEDRIEVKLVPMRQQIKDLLGITKENQTTVLLLMTVAALVGFVALAILTRAI